ncbi:MAG: gluconokinase [Chloroflexaceae bacterium]|jgi:gluconokinase|nr:gluconokinase [Chloroflexaceae bacterium]
MMNTSLSQQAATPLVLSLDIGSSSTRALVYDALGRKVQGSLASRPAAFRATADGGFEDDAPAALARVIACVDECLERVGTAAGQIGAVAWASYAASLLGLDAQNQPCTPVYPYAEGRSTPDATQLRAELDEAAVWERTGCPLRPAYHPARLRWLARTQSTVYARVCRWVSLAEYLRLQLCGTPGLTHSLAAWSGLLNRTTLDWDDELLAALALPREQLTAPKSVAASAGRLTATYARRWPALAEVPWFGAVGDGAAANVGSDCVEPGRVALTVGTTAALRAVLSHVAQVPPGLWCYQVDRGRALLGGATSEGGNLYHWLTSLLRLGDSQAIEAALAAAEPDGHGLTMLPFVAGERSPGYAGDVGASMVGLRLGTTSLDILQAGLEAVAYRLALIARRLLPATGHPSPLFVGTGGALLASPAWAQLLADVLGAPLAPSAEEEATARGAALLALENLGCPPVPPAPLEHVLQPSPERHARYQAAIARQVSLYERLVAS